MKKLNDKYASPAYWTQLIQLMLYKNINAYLKEHHLTQKAFAEQLGVSKGYVSQILAGDFDHKLSKLTELALACDFVPQFEWVPKQYAEQVAKSCYIQPLDWTVCKSYRHEVNVNYPTQATLDAAFSETTTKVSMNITMNHAVWSSQKVSSPHKIA